VNTVFLDTVGLIALWDRQDQWHAVAGKALAGIDLGRTRLVSTSYVLLECANHAARRPYRMEVVRMRENLGLGGDLFEPTAAEVDQAWIDYSQSSIGTASVIDIISFGVMRRLGVTEAFTNDRHFQAAEFTLLF
jgi:uncharacterized protein